MAVIKVELKNIIGEFLELAKPGKDCDAEFEDVKDLSCFDGFMKVCCKDGEYDSADMSAVAALLFEMQIKNNVPEEYVEASEKFKTLVKENKKLDISERRDYVFFAYEIMRELEKLENRAFAECADTPEGVYALAAQDDDISVIAVVNNTADDIMTNVEIAGLPGRHVSIDYYCAREYEPLSIVCNTDTKLSETTVMIPLTSYSLHLFKIR